MRLLALLLGIITLTSCVGYRLGSSKPSHLANVRIIAVPLFKNDTLQPRIAALATNSCVDAIIRDGTFRIGNTDNADATLEASVETIKYEESRSQRLDSLRPEELNVTVYIKWKLVDSNNQALENGTTKGTSKFFVDDNLQLSRENAYPDALKNASQNLVSRIANGF